MAALSPPSGGALSPRARDGRRLPLPALPHLSLSVGLGLARPVSGGVLLEPIQHENRPIGLCLGRRLDPWPCEARPRGPGMLCRPDPYRAVLSRARAVLGQAGPLAIYTRHRRSY